MIDIYEEIKQAKDYQLEICRDTMNRVYREASDNLTGRLTQIIHAACKDELAARMED